jgi:predicted nucleic acid-binding protein
MNGILPDTSAWADFFKPNIETPTKAKLVTLLDSKYQFYICPPVYQEVLQGISLNDTRAFSDTKRHLLKFRHGNVGVLQATDKAIEIYRTLRTYGITIRKPNDCLIAAYALLDDLGIIHNDRDFDLIENHFGLKVVH